MKEQLMCGTWNPQLKLRFNLKQIREPNKLTQIILVTTINKQRIRIYTKLRIEPKYWDKTTYRCRTDVQLNLRERMKLQRVNKQIDGIVKAVYETDEQMAEKGKYLSPSIIRLLVEEKQTIGNAVVSPIVCLYKQIDDYLEHVNRRGKRGVASTQKTYTTAIHRLENYCRIHKIQIKSLDDFDKHFFANFANYLYTCTYRKGDEKIHYTQNTIINTLKVIKNLLHRLYDSEMTHNNYFQKVQTTLTADASEQVYLKEDEIKKLAQMTLTDTTEKSIRDMFIIACYTSLRISDIQKLNEAVIEDGCITLYQTKTQERVQIPILKEITALINFYRKQGFPRFTANKANETIRKLAYQCGITEMVNYKEHRGGITTIKTKPKCQMISFHTARRSCITNLYKRGYPINYIMTLSGHRSIQAFQRYMRASSRELMCNFVTLLKKERAI